MTYLNLSNVFGETSTCKTAKHLETLSYIILVVGIILGFIMGFLWKTEDIAPYGFNGDAIYNWGIVWVIIFASIIVTCILKGISVLVQRQHETALATAEVMYLLQKQVNNASQK